MNSFRYGNLRRVQPTLCHLIDFITVQQQVGCESVMLIKKDVLILNGQKLVQSIFTNIVINDPEKVEKFIDALEASSHDPAWQAASPIKQPLTDIEKVREIMAKRGYGK